MAEPVAPDAPHWTEPGAWPVAAGVHRIPLPLPMDGLRAVNVYAIETDLGLTLVDGGWALDESRKALDAALGTIGYTAKDITRFLVTHAHRDHYTQAVIVRREFGSHVSLGIGERPTLLHMMNPPTHIEREIVAQLRRCGAPDLADEWSRNLAEGPAPLKPWELPDTFLDGEVAIELGGRALDAVPTPGHTQGHYVFHDREAGLLFAGDHILPTITPSIGFEPVQAELPLGDYLSSLAKVRARPDASLLPAHGPVWSSAHARIDELLAFHRDRLADSARVVDGGGRTAHEVARGLSWTRRDRSLSELQTFDRALAVMETRAHLEVLVRDGTLRVEIVDGVGVYFRAPAPAELSAQP